MAKTYKAIGDVTAYAAVKKYGYMDAESEREFAEQLIEALNAGEYAEQAARSADEAAEYASQVAEIYVDGTALIINTHITDGNEVAY